jgi:hypothetical protein
VSEQSSPQGRPAETPPVKEATFRMPRIAVVAAFLAMVGATPFAWSAWWLTPIYLVPIWFIVWVLRTQTTVNTETLTLRTTFRTRVLSWDELTKLNVDHKRKVGAELTSEEKVVLPGVQPRHLPVLAAFSSGRIPAFGLGNQEAHHPPKSVDDSGASEAETASSEPGPGPSQPETDSSESGSGASEAEAASSEPGSRPSDSGPRPSDSGSRPSDSGPRPDEPGSAEQG